MRYLARVTVERLLEKEGFPPSAEVSVCLVDDPAIRELNREYRGFDSPTDVLSFSMLEKGEGEPDLPADAGGGLLGDVVISMETALSRSGGEGERLEREFAGLLAHGVLHLLGYDHGTPEEEELIRSREEWVLGELGLGQGKP